VTTTGYLLTMPYVHGAPMPMTIYPYRNDGTLSGDAQDLLPFGRTDDPLHSSMTLNVEPGGLTDPAKVARYTLHIQHPVTVHPITTTNLFPTIELHPDDLARLHAMLEGRPQPLTLTGFITYTQEHL
jgi:hypothetical protein